VAQVAGSRNSLAIMADGRVLSWGVNDSRGGGDAWFVRGGHVTSIPDSGQLGRWWTPSRGGGRAVVGLAPGIVDQGELASEGALSVASGRYHALAIGKLTRAVYSWGLNDAGQLGRSALTGGRRTGEWRACERGHRCRDGTPRPVAGVAITRRQRGDQLPPAVAVAAGRYFSIAIGVDGRVYAWGRCACGRPADASTVEDTSDEGAGRFAGSTPYAITGGGLETERAAAVAAGYAHVLILTTSGTLYTCESGDDGYAGRLRTAPALNSFGQLGRESALPLLPAPVPAAALGEAPPALIAAGRCGSFLVDAHGDVFAWGCAQGSGHPSDQRGPAPLERMRGQHVHALAAGEYHALAATKDGGVVAWGAGATGAVGSSMVPAPIMGLPRAKVLALAAGYQHNLAVLPCGRHNEL
jgi:alpha-tubulin suppressor-like RCC1 family protein